MDALILILGIIVFGLTALFFFEIYRILENKPTISAYWHRWHRGRLFMLAIVGALLTSAWIFLMGDLVLELW